MADERRSEWTALGEQVDAGALYLERGTAANCAQHCATLLAELARLRDRAYGLQYVDGFGSFPSGIALAEKFSRKAVGGDYSMVQALTDHIAEVEAMRDVFLRIEAQYVTADESSAQALGAIGPDL
jgi:hypothetical protein